MGLSQRFKVWRHKLRAPDDFLDGCETDFRLGPQTSNLSLDTVVLTAGVPVHEKEIVLAQYRALFPVEES